MALTPRRTVKTAPESHGIKQPPHGRGGRTMDIPGHHRLQNLAFPHRHPPLQTLIKPVRTPRPHLTGQGTGAPGRFPNRFVPTGKKKRPDAGHPARLTLFLQHKKFPSPYRSVRTEPRPVPSYAQSGKRRFIFHGAGQHMSLMMLHRDNRCIPLPRQTPAKGKSGAVRMGVHGNYLRNGIQGSAQRLHRPLKSVQGSRTAQVTEMLAHDSHAPFQPADGILQSGPQGEHVGSRRRCAPHRPRGISAGAANHHGPAVRNADHGIVHGPHYRTVMHQKHIRHMAQFLQPLLHGDAQRLAAQVPAGHHQRLSPHIHQQRMKRGRRKHYPHKTAEHAHGRSQIHILPPPGQHNGGGRRSQQAPFLLRQAAQPLRRSHIRHHHGKRLGVTLLQSPETLDGSFRRSIRQQLETSYAQQGHNQTVRQHPCHLCRGGIKPMAEPQF